MQTARFGDVGNEIASGMGLDDLGRLVLVVSVDAPGDFGGVPLAASGSAVFIAQLTTR